MTSSVKKGFVHTRHHGKLERGRLILQKGNVYVNREDGENNMN